MRLFFFLFLCLFAGMKFYSGNASTGSRRSVTWSETILVCQNCAFAVLPLRTYRHKSIPNLHSHNFDLAKRFSRAFPRAFPRSSAYFLSRVGHALPCIVNACVRRTNSAKTGHCFHSAWPCSRAGVHSLPARCDLKCKCIPPLLTR